MPKGDKLTKKQAGFVKDYLETGNGTQSALKNYDTKDYSTADSIASENLQKPAIKKALGFRPDVVEKAKKKVEYLMDKAEQETVQLSAAKTILERSDNDDEAGNSLTITYVQKW